MELLVIGAAALCLVVIGVVAVALYVALKGRKRNGQG
jgi:hypothetical protein